MRTLSVVIPCYNEAANLPSLFVGVAPLLARAVEVLLVDNGSTDGSAALLAQAPAGIKVLRLSKNQGYGGGVFAGLKAAQGEYLSWTHADLQTDPNDILRAFTLIEQRGSPTDIYIKGVRTGRPLQARAISAAMSLFTSLILQAPLWEVNAMPNLCHRSFIEQWQNPPSDYNFELFSLYLARRSLRVLRIEVAFPPRVGGVSTWNSGFLSLLRMSLATLRYAFSLASQSDTH